MAAEKPVKSLSYEQALEELEGILGQLEGEISDLDKSLKLFERGQALAEHCADLLDKAQLKVKELSPDGELKDFSEE